MLLREDEALPERVAVLTPEFLLPLSVITVAVLPLLVVVRTPDVRLSAAAAVCLLPVAVRTCEPSRVVAVLVPCATVVVVGRRELSVTCPTLRDAVADELRELLEILLLEPLCEAPLALR